MVMMGKAKSAMDGHSILAAIANGRLAAQIAEQTSIHKEKAPEDTLPYTASFGLSDASTDDEHGSWTDDDEEEEMNLSRLRSKAKLISEVAVASNCLPAAAVKELQPKAPLASIAVLQEAIDTLQEIVSQPDKRSKPLKANKSCIEAEIPMATSPVDSALKEVESPAVSHQPQRPTSGKTATARPMRRKASKTQSTEERQSFEVQSPPSTPTTPPAKPPRPAKDRLSLHSSSSLRPQRTMKHAAKPVAKPTACFHMDMSGDESDAVATSTRVRDSSLTRAYDVLGVQHCSLDDGSDVDMCNAPQNTMSISSSYEALGSRLPALVSRPASPAGCLPPVKPNRRLVSAAAPEPVRLRTPSGPSAMELDLGSCGRSSFCALQDQEQTSTPLQQWRSPSAGSLPLIHASSKHSTSFTLPALPGVTAAGSSIGAKAVPKMRSGSVGARPWGMSAASSFREWDTRQLVF